MRALKVICGIAVLLMSLHMIHGIHHVLSHSGSHNAGVWAVVFAAAAVDVLSIIGGVLLLRPAS